MITQKISNGTVHKTPADIRKIFESKSEACFVWEDITPLARNEWICWIEDAKKEETRKRRIGIMLGKFKKGSRRPCCWQGCPHREKSAGKSST